MARAAIVGTGLIGASIGLGLAGSGWRVVGFDADPEAANAARQRGAVHEVARDLERAVAAADLVVLAASPAAIVATLPALATEALVTDVAGVKAPVVAAADHLPHFVGGHPMAGREQAGAAFASAALFRGASWILVEDGAAAADVERLAEIVTSLGAVEVRMSAAEHDAAVAAISHLPQVLASALVELAAADASALRLAAGSFRDLTRVALSEPQWWAEVLLANREQLGRSIGLLAELLGRWSTVLARGDEAAVAQALAAGRTVRAGLAPPVVAVGVALEDRPGELAGVGRALAASGVDVRDLQLRHELHGGGGILTLAVRPGEAETLRQALAAEGFTLTS